MDVLDLSLVSLSDWKILKLLAEEHGVAPLIYQKILKKEYTTGLPGKMKDFFKEKYYETTAKNTLLLNELEKILSILTECGVKVMLLKGGALVQKVYPDISLRPMTDIDLMVHPNNLRIATRTLKKSGYNEQKSTYHVVFWGGPAERVVVELHWNLMNSNLRSPDDVNWIWSDASFGKNAYSLRLEKELLFLVGHLLIQHNNPSPRLIWLYDLYLFLEKYYYDLDWDFINSNSVILGWRQVLADSIQICTDYFPSNIAQLALNRCEVDINAQQNRNPTRGWIPRVFRGMSLRRGIGTAKGMIFPGFSYMQWRYHLKSRKYIVMYYPKRWYELLKFVIGKKLW
jgi:hypothetical protein